MNIRELLETIRKACNECSLDNDVEIKEINLIRTFKLGKKVPIDYHIEIKIIK